MEEVLYPIRGSLQEFQEIQSIVNSDEILKFKPEIHDLTRATLMKTQYDKTSQFYKRIGPLTNSNVPGIYTEAWDSNNLLFIPAIENMGSEAQKSKWIPLAKSFKIFGCYAQTELAHGSDVANLQTEAVLDEKKSVFIISTPNDGAVKWWIKDASVAATHAIVFAKQIVRGNSIGVMPFIVQLKDTETRQVMKGIEVGDVGPKLGLNYFNHGFIRFSGVEVPLENMMGPCVIENGDVKFTKDPRIIYSGMMDTRYRLIQLCPHYLARANAIAVRYSLQRKQFKDSEENEVTIFDYILQRGKILPHIAEAYAYTFFGFRLKELMLQHKEGVLKGDFGMLGDIHSLISSSKAYITCDIVSGLEELRQSCGGHGYSMYSGIPELCSSFASLAVLEGDPTVLYLETANHLIKGFAGKKLNTSIYSYLSSSMESSNCNVETISGIVKIFQKTSAFTLISFVGGLRNIDKFNKVEASKTSGVSLIEIAKTHILAVIVESFAIQIETTSNPAISSVLTNLFKLFAYSKILENAKIFFQANAINAVDLVGVKKGLNFSLEILHKEAFNLVEAFGYQEETLASALVYGDGKLYERLFDWASKHNPINVSGKGKELGLLMKEGIRQTTPRL